MRIPLFMAGHFWSMGQFEQVYAAPPAFFGAGVESWATEIERLGFGEEIFFPFVYPPIWAAMAAPLAKTLGPAGFFNAFYVFHVTLIALSVVLAYRLIRPPVPLTLWCVISCVLLYISLIASSALFHNQLQITVTFLIILAFERYKNGASITAGIALGLAAAIKITPAALGLIFLLDKDIRAALSTAVTGLAVLALSFLIAGPEMHATFMSRIGTIAEQIALMHVNWNIESGLFQLWALLSGTELHTLPEMPNMPVKEPRNLSFENRLRTRPFGLLLIMTLCAPLGWSHHYLPVLLLIPALLTFMPPVRAIILLAAFGGLTSLPVFSILMDYGQSVHLQALLKSHLNGALKRPVQTARPSQMAGQHIGMDLFAGMGHSSPDPSLGCVATRSLRPLYGRQILCLRSVRANLRRFRQNDRLERGHRSP